MIHAALRSLSWYHLPELLTVPVERICQWKLVRDTAYFITKSLNDLDNRHTAHTVVPLSDLTDAKTAFLLITPIAAA